MAVMAPLTMCLGWRCSRVMCLLSRHSLFRARCCPSQGGLYNPGTAKFFSCSFGGDYGDDECVIQSDGALELYYTQAFSNGTVCSDATKPIVLYNGDAAVPISSSYSAGVLSCQDESISEFCAFDCAAGHGGVGIKCR